LLLLTSAAGMAGGNGGLATLLEAAAVVVKAAVQVRQQHMEPQTQDALRVREQKRLAAAGVRTAAGAGTSGKGVHTWGMGVKCSIGSCTAAQRSRQ
jgi:hypothetical protein